jgi:Lrp/AsnC family transcriptional regulator, leucine-responsive regulatory protein
MRRTGTPADRRKSIAFPDDFDDGILRARYQVQFLQLGSHVLESLFNRVESRRGFIKNLTAPFHANIIGIFRTLYGKNNHLPKIDRKFDHFFERCPIDRLDVQILESLQGNARMKNAEMARELGVAQSTLLERVRRLEEQGLIRGYRAIIDPEKLGLNIQAFVSVSMQRHEAETILKFEEGISKLPGVRACYHLTGRFDYLLHVAVKDLEGLGRLVKGGIAGLDGYGKSETFVIFSEIKPDEGLPIETTMKK